MSAAAGRFILIVLTSLALAILGYEVVGVWGAYLLGVVPLMIPLLYSYYNLQWLQKNAATADTSSLLSVGLWGEVLTHRASCT